jgi:YVTN family beta-propeller protein
VVGTIKVGKGPAGLLFDPDGVHLYVSNFGGKTVSVIDTLANRVVATVRTGKAPLEMAVDASRGRIYVTNFGSRSVSVIGTFSKTVLRKIRVGRKPFGVAVDSSRARALVANAADDTVSVIATDANNVVGTVTVGNGPLGIGIDPLRGRAYVANGTDDTVSILDTSAGSLAATLPVGNTPVAFGPFVGAIANNCPVRGLVCDDGNPSTADACVTPGSCQHTPRTGIEGLAAAMDALFAALGSASPDALGSAQRAQALRDAAERARVALNTAAVATDERARRLSLKVVKAELGKITRILEKGLRRGKIGGDVGLRLLDLARGTGALARAT